jgi:hypothetical protein
MNWTEPIWTLQWSLTLERFTEVSYLKYQEGWQWPNICDIFPKTPTMNNTVLRTPYSELISVNFMLKLYFEKSHWRKRYKHQRWGWGEHYLSFVRIYVLLRGITLICIAQYCQHPAVTSEFRLLPRGKCSRKLYSLTTYLRTLTTTELLTRHTMARKR